MNYRLVPDVERVVWIDFRASVCVGPGSALDPVQSWFLSDSEPLQTVNAE